MKGEGVDPPGGRCSRHGSGAAGEELIKDMERGDRGGWRWRGGRARRREPLFGLVPISSLSASQDGDGTRGGESQRAAGEITYSEPGGCRLCILHATLRKLNSAENVEMGGVLNRRPTSPPASSPFNPQWS